jgi:hypothetical protein
MFGGVHTATTLGFLQHKFLTRKRSDNNAFRCFIAHTQTCWTQPNFVVLVVIVVITVVVAHGLDEAVVYFWLCVVLLLLLLKPSSAIHPGSLLRTTLIRLRVSIS